MVTALRPACGQCGSTLFNRDEDGIYCGMCRRPYSLIEPVIPSQRQDAGRRGGLQTLRLYGREHFSKISGHGGRPKGRLNGRQ